MADLVLALNAGSSTVKFALFAIGSAPPVLRLRGLVENLGHVPRFTAWSADGTPLEELSWPGGSDTPPEAYAEPILGWVEARLHGEPLSAIAHRIAHGGPDFKAPVILTPAVLERLERLCSLAPLHQPHNLAMARTAMRLRPHVPAVAGFDTAFFHALPASAQCIPIEHAVGDPTLRRYGFHGLSYSYLQRRLEALHPWGRPRRTVFAHLGSGASLCACLNGAPIETTMGFSPLDGLVMSTRCGRLDPGVVLHLLRNGLDANAIENLLYRRSGLLAVSGLSGDMRTLLASHDDRAAAAVELFVGRVVQEIGGLAACLGGLDTLVFSAGIGEHAADIRALICDRLGWLGVDLDAQANAVAGPMITRSKSAVSVWVIPTDEETVLAEGAASLLGRDVRLSA